MADFNPYDLPGDAPNPYAPPRADLTPGKTYLPGKTVLEPFSVEAVWRMTWSIFKERMGLIIGIVLGAGLISNVPQFLAGVVLGVYNAQGLDPTTSFMIQVVITIIGVVFSLWLSCGMVLGLLKIANGEEASVGDVFSGGRYWLSTVWGTFLLIVCFVGAVFAVAALIGGIGGAIATAYPKVMPAFILGAVICGYGMGFYIMIRLYFYQYAIVDRGLGGWGAIKFSYKMTEGRVLQLIALGLFAVILQIGGALACLIGLLFTSPLVIFMLTCAYVMLANQVDPRISTSDGLEFEYSGS